MRMSINGWFFKSALVLACLSGIASGTQAAAYAVDTAAAMKERMKARPVAVHSPDRQNEIVLTLTRKGVELIAKRHGAEQARTVFIRQGFRDAEDAPNGRTCVIANVERRKVEGTVPAPVYKKSRVDLAAQEAVVRFKDAWGIILRARNDGVAYRLFYEKEGMRTIWCEDTQLVYPSAQTKCWAGFNNGSYHGDQMQNSWETVFKPTTVGAMPLINKRLTYLPFVTENNGVFTAFTESDIRDYPGINLVRWGFEPPGTLRFWHAQKAKRMAREDVYVRVKEREKFFARVPGRRAFPWRVFVMGDQPSDLAAADIVWALAEGVDPKADFAWVKPGMTTWEWWYGANITGVDFKSGVNTPTYLHHIDFAAEYGIPYLLMDAGWSKVYDIHALNENVDLKKITAHAKTKGVGVILWCGSSQIMGREEEAIKYLASLGAAGLKIDFLDRDDQDAVSYIERTAAVCAKYHLVIDWHGMFKPTGLERRYPNILNYEGIFGLEVNRWDRFNDMPRHNCQAAFTRMVAGPMDYTPGGMRNATRAAFRPARNLPSVQGTRAHQMALMALFFAPMQMMADSPSEYRANSECARFMAATPTVWDDTVALPCVMGQTAALARRKGDEWWIAVIGDWTPRTFAVPTSFLGKGNWTADIFTDSSDADQHPTHFEHRQESIAAGTPIKVKLAPGGGFIARLHP